MKKSNEFTTIGKKWFAFFPTKLTNGQWIWLKSYLYDEIRKEHEGFTEGVGNHTYNTYHTTKKYQ